MKMSFATTKKGFTTGQSKCSVLGQDRRLVCPPGPSCVFHPFPRLRSGTRSVSKLLFFLLSPLAEAVCRQCSFLIASISAGGLFLLFFKHQLRPWCNQHPLLSLPY